jgi:hypothetical protein
MVACARRRLVGRGRRGVFHCWTRCVRRAFLCGRDRVTGVDYSHRRDWILQREEQLAALFAIDVEFHTELSNHLHLVLRTCPEAARRWSRAEVARRWLTITKLAKCLSDELPKPDPRRVEQLAKDKKKIDKLRLRLCSVSWFMGILSENIARRANAEDDCRGRFWESRFKCRECTSQNGILVCGLYVDLNLMKAGEATSLETARYSSLFQRMQAQRQPESARRRADGWLGELTLRAETREDATLGRSSRTGRRASDLGLIPISLEDYIKLARWTVQAWRSGQPKTIPADLEAVLEGLDIRADAWQQSLEDYEQEFCHAVGPPSALAEVAARMEGHHIKGMAASRRLFRESSSQRATG